jgi:cell cycle checkpoint protein
VCVALGSQLLNEYYANTLLLQRLLILKGPAGSGKTTTVSLLSKAMEFDISEWRSPTVSDTGISSFSSQFDDFLNRGGAFGALDLSSGVGGAKHVDISCLGHARNRVLLVEEFPSTMTLSSSALASFRYVLLQYLTAAVPPCSPVFDQSKSGLNSHPPIVLIISESLLTSATASTDSFTAHRLLGPDLCNHSYATILEFNPVAPTLVTKALELAIKKEARISKRRRIPGPAILKRLSELGDVRSAVNGLEFLCVRGDADAGWGGRTAAKTKRSDTSSSSLTAMEKESLELVTQREATLGIFHAVGKVVWNKREDPRIADPRAQPPPKPPDHMSTFERPKISQVDTDELLNEIGTDIQTFIAALHENYVLSANGSYFANSASDCMDLLSESDLLSPGSRQITRSSRSSHGSRGAIKQAGGVDMLRQNEISFQVAVRGLLFSLSSPVSRAPHPNGRKGDSFKMFYPASLKVWKPGEEISDLVSLEMSRLLASSTDGAETGHSDAKADGVEAWKSRSFSFRAAVEHETQQEDTAPRVWATRDEVILERLPYTVRTRLGNGKRTREIKKITQLNGILLNNDEEVDEENADVAVDLSAADETTDRTTSPKKRTGFGRNMVAVKETLDPAKETAMEKLYISEDDIEDG